MNKKMVYILILLILLLAILITIIILSRNENLNNNSSLKLSSYKEILNPNNIIFTMDKTDISNKSKNLKVHILNQTDNIITTDYEYQIEIYINDNWYIVSSEALYPLTKCKIQPQTSKEFEINLEPLKYKPGKYRLLKEIYELNSSEDIYDSDKSKKIVSIGFNII